MALVAAAKAGAAAASKTFPMEAVLAMAALVEAQVALAQSS